MLEYLLGSVFLCQFTLILFFLLCNVKSWSRLFPKTAFSYDMLKDECFVSQCLSLPWWKIMQAKLLIVFIVHSEEKTSILCPYLIWRLVIISLFCLFSITHVIVQGLSQRFGPLSQCWGQNSDYLYPKDSNWFRGIFLLIRFLICRS